VVVAVDVTLLQLHFVMVYLTVLVVVLLYQGSQAKLVKVVVAMDQQLKLAHKLSS